MNPRQVLLSNGVNKRLVDFLAANKQATKFAKLSYKVNLNSYNKVLRSNKLTWTQAYNFINEPFTATHNARQVLLKNGVNKRLVDFLVANRQATKFAKLSAKVNLNNYSKLLRSNKLSFSDAYKIINDDVLSSTRQAKQASKPKPKTKRVLGYVVYLHEFSVSSKTVYWSSTEMVSKTVDKYFNIDATLIGYSIEYKSVMFINYLPDNISTSEGKKILQVNVMPRYMMYGEDADGIPPNFYDQLNTINDHLINQYKLIRTL